MVQPTFTAAFHDGQTIQLPDGTLGQVYQTAFLHGQYRYCIATHRDSPFVWEWEGHLRSKDSTIYGR